MAPRQNSRGPDFQGALLQGRACTTHELDEVMRAVFVGSPFSSTMSLVTKHNLR